MENFRDHPEVTAAISVGDEREPSVNILGEHPQLDRIVYHSNSTESSAKKMADKKRTASLHADAATEREKDLSRAALYPSYPL